MGTMSQPPTDADAAADARRLRRCFTATLAFAALLWIIELVELVLDLDLARYGVYPASLRGLVGVAFAPLIHGSPLHLLSNTPPLIILGTALLYGYPRSAKLVLPTVYFGAGIGVWLFGRSAWHIGASGLTFGMMFFVFTMGVLRWDTRSIALALVVFLLYGGMIWGIFPGDPSVSFESHLAGALIGITLALLLKNRDPAPARKRYSWEDEEQAPEPEPWPPPDWTEPDPDRQARDGQPRAPD
jgi:membrane associated rhomboid family serine protease